MKALCTIGLLFFSSLAFAQSYRCIFYDFASTGGILNEIRFSHMLDDESVFLLESRNVQVNQESLQDDEYFEVVLTYERDGTYIESSYSDNRNNPVISQ